jgi:hypothetical protein
MANGKRLRLNDAGLSNLRKALGKCAPGKVDLPPEPTMAEIGGKAILDALAPVVYLAEVTVKGREKAITDFVRKIKDGDTTICITDQALGAANLPVEPIVRDAHHRSG